MKKVELGHIGPGDYIKIVSETTVIKGVVYNTTSWDITFDSGINVYLPGEVEIFRLKKYKKTQFDQLKSGDFVKVKANGKTVLKDKVAEQAVHRDSSRTITFASGIQLNSVFFDENFVKFYVKRC